MMFLGIHTVGYMVDTSDQRLKAKDNGKPVKALNWREIFVSLRKIPICYIE